MSPSAGTNAKSEVAHHLGYPILTVVSCKDIEEEYVADGISDQLWSESDAERSYAGRLLDNT